MSGRFLMTRLRPEGVEYYMVRVGLREFRRNGAIRDIIEGVQNGSYLY